MAFVTGLLLIDAPASALNNLGALPGARTDNMVGVKVIRAGDGAYPYVSAQAFRYWLRTTLEDRVPGWEKAPVYREDKVAYTGADPIEWWDDDLFGYMRSPGDSPAVKQKREQDEAYRQLPPLEKDNKGNEKTVTRISPFRVSTLVSIAPVNPTEDFGTMSRPWVNVSEKQGPVPYEHQFYRATLQGLFSLDLHAAGTFSYAKRTGYLNLDAPRVERAQKEELEHLESEKCYRLPPEKRTERVAALFRGMACLGGGAKQAVHYTDVSPDLVMMAVTRGGNNIFGHVIGANSRGLPELKVDALLEAVSVHNEEILSPIYVGWTRGYLDRERAKLEALCKGPADETPPDPDADPEQARLQKLIADRVRIAHPRHAFSALADALRETGNRHWIE